jgi:hypothetical protein
MGALALNFVMIFMYSLHVSLLGILMCTYQFVLGLKTSVRYSCRLQWPLSGPLEGHQLHDGCGYMFV